MAERKTDRRTIMTKQIIKDALLELLPHTPYEKITVTALCKQAEITRTTFYLHYDNIDDVLNETLDDALRLTELDTIPSVPQFYLHNLLTVDADITAAAEDRDAFLPACQRAASDPKYCVLFLDETMSHHILEKLYRQQYARSIPDIMQRYNVNQWEAEKLFLFMLHGSFAVNKSLGWNKNEDWYHAQSLIQKLLAT